MVDQSRANGDASRNDEAMLHEVAAIPLLEERLSVEKRQVEKGRVRVHVKVEEREEVLREHLRHDDLKIERVPRNVRVNEVPRVRLEGNLTIVPVVEEVLIVEKAMMLVEEIHICRGSVTEEAEMPVTIRTERAEIQREPAAVGSGK